MYVHTRSVQDIQSFLCSKQQLTLPGNPQQGKYRLPNLSVHRESANVHVNAGGLMYVRTYMYIIYMYIPHTDRLLVSTNKINCVQSLSNYHMAH